MKELLKKMFPFLKNIKKNYYIRKKLKEIYKEYKSNWIESSTTQNTIGYKIILDEHALEKGMTSKNPRFFGIQKVNNIMKYIMLYENENYEKDFAYNLGISILKEYCKYYEDHNWINRDEYLKVKEFINKRSTNIVAGSYLINKETFINDSKIDYDKFLSSRHSFREFDKKRISSEDMKKAVSMAMKTPTACNRQMCKIYFINSKDKCAELFKYSHGLTGFNNDTVNMIIVTYDISSLCFAEEIQQGMFNAGLFSMNLVNALHSLGIGSCFLEYSNSIKEEAEEKELLNIPINEKIAVVLAAGYYPEVSRIPYSTRKPIDEIYRER